MLGVREPEIYGTQTLDDVEQMCRDAADRLGLDVDCRQSNHEGEMVTWIQNSFGRISGLVINAGAYTHTSIAIHDALKLYGGAIPIAEVHITDPKTREKFRHFSYIEELAFARYAGHGVMGYVRALEALAERLGKM